MAFSESDVGKSWPRYVHRFYGFGTTNKQHSFQTNLAHNGFSKLKKYKQQKQNGGETARGFVGEFAGEGIESSAEGKRSTCDRTQGGAHRPALKSTYWS